MNTKKEATLAAIEAGKEQIKRFFDKAIENGTVYYSIEHVSASGMQREIKLFVPVVNREGKLEIEQLFPGVPALDMDAEKILGGYSESLAVVARDWGFSFKKRAFVIRGCGMDMVFALLDNLGYKAGFKDLGNTLRRESL